ncbi:hypothetical protein VQ643_04190 [Pseudomonas sp. F1_0610]|uniref:hypothetical protein n=1 Tax=Pseudomonas sp. F1_0610 TaxID=3114284 RepID=UPI0039C04ECA
MTKLATGRKAIHLEQRGGKSNRQRIWEVIRANRTRFSATMVAHEAQVNYDTTCSYFQGLKKAGVIAHCLENDGTPTTNAFSEKSLYLVKDLGVEAPQISKSGKASRAGEGTEAMWRTLRMLPNVTVQELAGYASAGVEVKVSTAQSYIKWLLLAGYVQHNNGKPRRYSLIKAKVKGPRAPQIQRIGQVYDPNTAEVVYAQNPEDLL